MTRILTHVKRQAVGYLALFVALGGTGYAAVNLPRNTTVEVDFVADNPGPSLLHCHMQQHMDYGFKTIVKYA